MADESWKVDAACVGIDPALFFPVHGEMSSTREAKATCARCPVREACLEYALTHSEKAGIWGGLSGRERKRLGRPKNVTTTEVA